MAGKGTNYARNWGLCFSFWIMLFEADYAKNYASILYQCLLLSVTLCVYFVQVQGWFLLWVEKFFFYFYPSIGRKVDRSPELKDRNLHRVVDPHVPMHSTRTTRRRHGVLWKASTYCSDTASGGFELVSSHHFPFRNFVRHLYVAMHNGFVLKIRNFQFRIHAFGSRPATKNKPIKPFAAKSSQSLGHADHCLWSLSHGHSPQLWESLELLALRSLRLPFYQGRQDASNAFTKLVLYTCILKMAPWRFKSMIWQM